MDVPAWPHTSEKPLEEAIPNPCRTETQTLVILNSFYLSHAASPDFHRQTAWRKGEYRPWVQISTEKGSASKPPILSQGLSPISACRHSAVTLSSSARGA